MTLDNVVTVQSATEQPNESPFSAGEQAFLKGFYAMQEPPVQTDSEKIGALRYTLNHSTIPSYFNSLEELRTAYEVAFIERHRVNRAQIERLKIE